MLTVFAVIADLFVGFRFDLGVCCVELFGGMSVVWFELICLCVLTCMSCVFRNFCLIYLIVALFVLLV